MSFRFHPDAMEDLNALYEHIAENDRDAAAGLIETIHDSCRLLGENPRAGRARPDLHPELRSFPSGPVLLLYRVNERDAEIIYIAHGRRDLMALIERAGR